MMKIINLSLDELHPYENNPRNNDLAVDKVAQSLKEFGWQQPIVVDANRNVIAGHTRLKAAKLLGLTEAPVVIADQLTEAQVKAYRLADNRVGQEAEWDDGLLITELLALQDLDVDLALTGFEPQELDALLNIEALLDTDDAIVEPDPAQVAVSQHGDLWQLGAHRLLCGDAAQIDDIEKLMDGELADLIFTDPPYNVNYVTAADHPAGIKNDSIGHESFTDLLNQSFANLYLASRETGSFYICHAGRTQLAFEQALLGAGFSVRVQLIWAKHHFALSQGRYHFKHEPIFYGHKTAYADCWYGDNKQTTLWEFTKPWKNKLHPTMKPVELVQKALRNSSKRGHIVLDSFAGSGTTLMACEQTGRRAYCMELDPKYVDVIINRWQQATNKKAIHIETQKTFDDMKSQTQSTAP